MDETYIKIKGKYWYYYRAVDKCGDVIAYYLSKHRDEAAAKAFLNKDIAQNGLPEKVVIDGNNANYAALDAMNVQLWLTGYFMLCLIDICNVKYLNNIVEQSHRWVKQKTSQALGWKIGRRGNMYGREIWKMLKRGKIDVEGESAVDRFYDLAGQLCLEIIACTS